MKNWEKYLTHIWEEKFNVVNVYFQIHKKMKNASIENEIKGVNK